MPLVLFSCLLVMLFIVIICLKSNREAFREMIDGICECCSCGLMTCQDCSKMAQKCCPNMFQFTRYRFNE